MRSDPLYVMSDAQFHFCSDAVDVMDVNKPSHQAMSSYRNKCNTWHQCNNKEGQFCFISMKVRDISLIGLEISLFSFVVVLICWTWHVAAKAISLNLSENKK